MIRRYVDMKIGEARFKSAAGNPGRIAVARILPGSDLIEAVEKICKENNIKSASVVSCIGALREAALLNPVLADSSPPKSDVKEEGEVRTGYGEALTITGPLQILAVQGTISTAEDGKMVVHMHAIIVDGDHNVYGGHVPKGKNFIDDTAEVTIQEVVGIKMLLKYDPETKEHHLSPEENRSHI
jgi:predicted DNA-binding protein with PD1-like motif